MKRVLVSLAFVALGGAAAPELPELSTIDRIEDQVRLPPRAGSLDSYDRYYAIERQGGTLVIRGRYLAVSRADAGDGGRPSKRKGHVVRLPRLSEAPMVADGGCVQVNLVYVVETGKLAAVSCNGVA